MYWQILFFSISTFLCLSLSRLLLSLWQYKRVHNAGGLRPIMFGGLRVDTTTVGFALALPLLLAPWFNDALWAQQITAVYLSAMWLLILLPELSSVQFIMEYDVRPNRLYTDYLKHPKEVAGMLWQGYKLPVFGALVLLALLCYAGSAVFGRTFPFAQSFSWPAALGLSLASAAVSFLAIRGTLRHRPLNPSTVAYCGDCLLNSLALNSTYNVAYALYSLKNERSAADLYGDLPTADMQRLVLDHAGIQSTHPELPSLHQHIANHSHARPLNIVIIVEESLGAQFVGNLGGQDLTPNLDKLSTEGWNFRKAYATGTRSVRGLEALVCGFPPSASDAVLRLSGAQQNFFTLAQGLKPLGYRSHFVYGGEAHFDNMKGFFMGNGFDELHERAQFKDPAFVGTWGASDEDMFNKVHEILSDAHDTPTLCLAFSVSNHSPWEYPSGRITPEGETASVQNTVRYADWAIGQFFDRAKQESYWENTVFLVAADHDARVGGADAVPLRHFHIPALILGGTVAARQDDRIISQIDLPVTLLSLADASIVHPMIGQDLTKRQTVERAIMQYGENFGYLQQDLLTVLEPGKKHRQFTYTAPADYQVVETHPQALETAKAYALWPTYMYDSRSYTIATTHDVQNTYSHALSIAAE
ncbi:LTA synthase family protein [Paenalcaligenes sp. Me131]|uniref:LTA synthase family protein n=1 Tax=Paenalcaligenes sp. Me131 TaxID=3392636 RepID=UPI003D26DDD1